MMPFCLLTFFRFNETIVCRETPRKLGPSCSKLMGVERLSYGWIWMIKIVIEGNRFHDFDWDLRTNSYLNRKSKVVEVFLGWLIW